MPHLLAAVFRNGISAGWQLPQAHSGQHPQVQPPSDEGENKIGALSTGAPPLHREGERTEVLSAASQMLQCPWMLLTLLGFLMFPRHPQPFLLPAEEV